MDKYSHYLEKNRRYHIARKHIEILKKLLKNKVITSIEYIKYYRCALKFEQSLMSEDEFMQIMNTLNYSDETKMSGEKLTPYEQLIRVPKREKTHELGEYNDMGLTYGRTQGLSQPMKELADVILKMKKDIKFIKKCQTEQGANAWLKSHKYDVENKDHKKWSVNMEDIDRDEIPDVVVRDRDDEIRLINGYQLTKKDALQRKYVDYKLDPQHKGEKWPYRKWTKKVAWGANYDGEDPRLPNIKPTQYKGVIDYMQQHDNEYLLHKPRKLSNLAVITQYIGSPVWKLYTKEAKHYIKDQQGKTFLNLISEWYFLNVVAPTFNKLSPSHFGKVQDVINLRSNNNQAFEEIKASNQFKKEATTITNKILANQSGYKNSFITHVNAYLEGTNYTINNQVYKQETPTSEEQDVFTQPEL